MESNDAAKLAVEYQSIVSLKPNPRNARSHSAQQIRLIARSIQEFGFRNPVLVDQQNVIVAGHGRVRAAQLLKMEQIPTIRIEGLTETQLRAYVLADNRIAERAGWDSSILAIELQHLTDLDLQFDVTLTGFEMAEIDLTLTENAQKAKEPETFDVELSEPAITATGDLWELGKHRLYCGNALDTSSFRVLMEDHRASLVFADPPFNLKIADNVSGKGQVRHPDFAMASGELSEAEFEAFLLTSLRNLSRYSKNGSIHYVCMDWRHMGELLAAGEQVYDGFLNLCVWTKDNAGQGSLYRSQHELICVFKHGRRPHRNNVMLGKFGRYRSNVWEYPCAKSFSKGSEGNLLNSHPTVKPLELVADAILDCSARGDLVLDSFLGSGTTLIAAERVGRVCYGMELEPRYVDVAIRRWERYTGDQAVHVASGHTFAEHSSDLAGEHVQS